jgi:membrane-associated phospholipid phosphatase
MKSRTAIELPPTKADIVLSRTVAEHVDRPAERDLGIVTWLADENIVLGFAAVYWAYLRFSRTNIGMKADADAMLASVALAGLVPHIFKRFVNRERPNRTQAPFFPHGIKRLGQAWDSFPSGHALHLGALASAGAQLAPRGVRPFVWPTAIGLACTRILLLAHYPTDVLAGLTFGALLHKAIRAFMQRLRARSEVLGESTHSERMPAIDSPTWANPSRKA